MARSTRTSTRRKPSQDRSRSLVAAVLEAAAQVLEERGYEGATIARIAERAGVSVGSLYQYFGTKDALFEALTDALLARVLGVVVPVVVVPGASFDERVERAFLAGITELRPYPRVLRLLAAGIGTAFHARLSTLRVEAHRYALALLATHPRATSFRNPDLAARVLVDASEGLLLNLRSDDEPAVLAREARRLVEGYCAGW